MATRMQMADPDVGLSELVRRLSDDSKRLVKDEVRLSKLEMRDSVHSATRGLAWLGLALGVGVVALVALTILATAAIGAAVNHNYWVGAFVTGVVELAVGFWLLRSGAARVAEPSYSLPESRAEVRSTANWVGQQL